jgi:hypothetical protein
MPRGRRGPSVSEIAAVHKLNAKYTDNAGAPDGRHTDRLSEILIPQTKTARCALDARRSIKCTVTVIGLVADSDDVEKLKLLARKLGSKLMISWPWGASEPGPLMA